MLVQLTDAGVALLQANTGPVQLTAAKLGSAFGYVPSPTDVNIRGTLVYAAVPSQYAVVSANVFKYSIYLDYDLGPFNFGEVGLFTSDGTLFALAANSAALSKLPITSNSAGNSVRLDLYLSIVGDNYEMWLDYAETSNQFRMAVLGSVDQLPQPQNATPNAYVLQGLSAFQSSYLAYTDRAGLWSFDAYAYASQVSASVKAFDSRSVTIPLSQYVSNMNPTYFGEVILEFTSGSLYGVCRYVKTVVISGNNVTLGFNTPVLITPTVGDTFVTFKRNAASNESTIPVATTGSLGGIIVGPSLTVQSDGTLDVDYTKITYPVKTVAGRTGDVVLAYSDISGLATVAHSGDYNDLINKPAAYALPVATTAVLGGVKAPANGNLTISGTGVIDLGFTPVTSVNGNSGAILINQANPSGFATVAFTGSYNDLSNKPTAYSLPVATTTVLGGVKQGAGISIAGDGTISVAGVVTSVSGQTGVVTVKASNANIATGASLISDDGSTTANIKLRTVVAGTNISTSLDASNNLVINSTYALPIAGASTLGGIKVGTGLTVAGDGTLSVSAVGGVTSVSGQTGAVVVKAQDNNTATGTSLIVGDGSGTAVIRLKTIVAGTGIGLTTDGSGNMVVSNTASAYTLPVATATVLGGVKQGANVTIAGDGTISVAAPSTYTLPVATTTVLGGVKQGTGVSIAGDGTLSAAVTSVSGQGGAVVIQASDNNTASGTSLISNSGATTGNIKLKTIVAGTGITLSADGNGNLQIASTASGGVTTFNTRSGAVTLTGTDISGAGGALTTDVAAAKYYDVSGGAGGAIVSGQLLCLQPLVRQVTFPANFAGSVGYAGTAPTTSFTVTVAVDGTTIGTAVFGAGANSATFTTTGGTQKVANAGQRITMTAPGTADATIANVAATLLGVAT